ncbi:MAG: hypothetical protein L6M37_02915 [Candidatus Methylarchaceae archaeon HK02M1]|nr:hypothetical protein [Candidatus Methylarchaceae archaeon HK02M1]
MGEGNIFRTLEKDGTTFTVFRGHEDGFDSDFFIKASGRLNFIRGIQSFDAYLLKSGSYFMMLKYVTRGPFTVIEEGEEYLFEPSLGGWLVKHGEQSFELKGDREVLDIISASTNVKEVLGAQKIAELITEESKKALSALSDMISENLFDHEIYARIERYAEEVNDERVKDMLRIVQKHFRERPDSEESDVDIRVIE